MDDAALTRRHGAEAVGLTVATNFFGGGSGGECQLVDAERAKIPAVEPDFFVLVALKVQDFGREQFEGAKEFAVTVEKKRGIRAGKFHQDLRMLPLAIFGDGRIDGDAVLEFEGTMADDGLQKFANLLGGGDFVGDWHR